MIILIMLVMLIMFVMAIKITANMTHDRHDHDHLNDQSHGGGFKHTGICGHADRGVTRDQNNLTKNLGKKTQKQEKRR